jgi:FkbH-like protein
VTLNEALALGNVRRGASPLRKHRLVCGFEPLHLATLLRAHLLKRLPGDVELQCGVYGDFLGNLAASTQSDAIAAAVVLEWSDIDPRLGLRSSGGWTSVAKAEILKSTLERYAFIETALAQLATRMPVGVVPPSLPFPPIGNTRAAQISAFELELAQQLGTFLLRISVLPGVRIARLSSVGDVLDARMELMVGFPYSVDFADKLAAAVAEVLWPAPVKKGLITDADDTLWRGIVGEVGPEAVSWSQDAHTQAHGLYQQMLGNLSDQGVLIGICSKNELSVVEAALGRDDLFVSPEIFFPIHASWGAKSAGIAHILETWNVGADSVVFVDDNLMELEEVRQAYPDITGVHFNGKDANVVWQLLEKLRDLFGKPVLVEEDQIRANSIRTNATIKKMAGGEYKSPEFLKSLDGTVTISWHVAPSDKRPLDLINKTNQFNLNGYRISEGDWQRALEDRATVIAIVSYADKFGPLGKVAVVMGRIQGDTLRLTHWVMSCRAFSRNVEHHTLHELFRQTGVEQMFFDVIATERNKPLQNFFREVGISQLGSEGGCLTRAQFTGADHARPHKVIHFTGEVANMTP